MKLFWLSELAVTGKKIQLGKCNRTRHTRCLQKFITFYHLNIELVWSDVKEKSDAQAVYSIFAAG